MNFAVRHTTCCVSDVLLISLSSPVFIEIQNMNFAVTQQVVCLTAKFMFCTSMNTEIRSTALTQQVVCLTLHVLYLNEYWRQRNQELTQQVVCLTAKFMFCISMNIEIQRNQECTNTTSRMPNSKVHVLYLNEYGETKEIRST